MILLVIWLNNTLNMVRIGKYIQEVKVEYMKDMFDKDLVFNSKKEAEDFLKTYVEMTEDEIKGNFVLEED